MYSNVSIWEELKHKYTYGGSHVRLIMINVMVFLAIHLILLTGNFLINGNYGTLIVNQFKAVADAGTMLTKPWSAFTYMFIHERVLHLLFNMLVMYWFGNVIKDLIGNPKIVPLYIYGGLAGLLLFMTAYNIFPVFAGQLNTPIIGASAGVMAIVIAAATLAPDYEFRLLLFGRVKIKWIALFYIIIDILQINSTNSGGHIAHLGGALIGFIYIRLLQRGTDMAKPFYYIEDFFERVRKPRRRIKVVHKKEEKVKAGSNQGKKQATYTESSISKQEQLDTILDKINRSGYDSLSADEKAFLFKVSQED